MGFLWRWVERLKGLVTPGRQDAETMDEIRFHVDMEIREGIARGLSAKEARRTALRNFGGVERYREQTRDVRWASWLHDLRRDVRVSLRSLARRPGYTFVVVFTLALGVGVTTAFFTVVDGVLLRPLPYPDGDELLRVRNSWAGSPAAVLSPAELVDLAEWLTDFDAVGGYAYGSLTFSGGGQAERVRVAWASSGTWEALAVSPALGRVYSEEEDRASAPVAVLTDGFWRSRFGADPQVVGRTVQMNGFAIEVVGVLPPEFRMPEDMATSEATQLVRPLGLDPATVDRQERGSHFISAVARLGAGMSVADGQRRLAEAGEQMVAMYPDEYPAEMQFRTSGVPLLVDLVGPVRPMLFLLLGAVGLAFAIVCANVASLQLARTAARLGELALRRALGAGRGRLAVHVIVESLVIAVGGALLGTVVAMGATALAVRVVPATVPRIEGLGPDAGILAFGALLGVVSGVLFGLGPALLAGREEALEAMEPGRRATGSNRGKRMRDWIVTGQVAVAVLLAATAALATRSFVSLSAVDPGYRTEDIVSARVGLPSAGYPTAEEVGRFFEELLTDLRGLPGVTEAGAVTNLPLATTLGDMSFELEEDRVPEGRDKPDADWQVVTPRYFETMEMEVTAGRSISETDRADTPGAVVINRTMADAHWPGASPIGRRLRLGGQRTEPRWAEVVGIVDDVRHTSFDEAERPQMYFAQSQFRFWSNGQPVRSLTLVVQSTLPAAELGPAIRTRLAARDPDLALYALTTLAEAKDRSLARPRFTASLLGAFSGFALLLALVGVYGVMMYAVRQRTPEFGIRIALGAAPGTVLGRVLRDASRIVVPGVAVGLLGTIALSTVLRRFLFEVSPADPVSLSLTVVGVVSTGLLASYLPARVAARSDPIRALRAD